VVEIYLMKEVYIRNLLLFRSTTFLLVGLRMMLFFPLPSIIPTSLVL
jgi:hypothetical protein